MGIIAWIMGLAAVRPAWRAVTGEADG